MKLNGWQLVTLAALGLAAFVALAIFGKDPTTLIAALVGAVLTIAGAFGYREMASAKQDIAVVKSQTNGNSSDQTALIREMLGHIKDQGTLLASMQPTAVEDLAPVSPAR
jgi:hypothetical protein